MHVLALLRYGSFNKHTRWLTSHFMNEGSEVYMLCEASCNSLCLCTQALEPATSEKRNFIVCNWECCSTRVFVFGIIL